MTLLKQLAKAAGVFAIFLSNLTNAEILEIREHDDVVYALNDNQAILRFDLASGSELPTINLANPAQHFAVSANQIYTSNNRELRRISVADGSTVYIGGASADVIALSAEDQVILTAEADDHARTYSESGQILNFNSFYSLTLAEFNNEKSSDIYYRYSTDICRIYISDTNRPEKSCSYTYHYDKKSPTYFLSASESRLILSSGFIIDTDQNKIISRLPFSRAIAAASLPDSFLVKTDTGTFEQYSKHGIPQGRYSLTAQTNYLTSFNENYVSLVISDNEISGTYLSPESDLIPSQPVRISPELPENNSELVPEKILKTQSGDAIIYDKDTSAIYIWDLSSGNYSSSYNIGADATAIEYDAYTSTIYSTHRDGYLRKIDLSDDIPYVVELAYLSPDEMTSIAIYMERIQIASAKANNEYSISPEGFFISSSGYAYSDHDPTYWSDENSAFYRLTNSYLSKLTYNQTTKTQTSSDNAAAGLISNRQLSIIPELNSIFLSNGNIISMDSMANTHSLSSNISDASYPSGNLITVSEDKSALQIWSDSFELVQSINKGSNADLRLLYDSTYLGVIQVTKTNTIISRYDLIAGGDADSDSVDDLYDNCPEDSNTEQEDLDSDHIGDVCDSDIDGDLIPNSIEILNSLNPRDDSDKAKDKDSDGLPNFYEYLIGTDISEPSSAPLNGKFTINFDDGLIPDYIISSGGYWFTASDDNGDEGFDLRGPAAIANRPLPYIMFYAYFDGTGKLTYEATSYNYYYYSQYPDLLKVYIDGFSQTPTYGGWEGDYIDVSNFSAGMHQVKIELQIPGSTFGEHDGHLIIDDIRYTPYEEPDEDSDGVPDTLDNCYWDYNPTQSDSDRDGVGDACDGADDDKDDDLIQDWFDNCPTDYNPDQVDTDGNGSGDVCDPITEDHDRDGLPNNQDNCPWESNVFQSDTDNDGIGDACDLGDTDDDGRADYRDNCPAVINPEQKDQDRDYIGDACDSDIDGDSLNNDAETAIGRDPHISEGIWYDSDSDGVADFIENRFGTSPVQAEKPSTMDLRPYYPVGNLSVTTSWYGQQATYKMEHIEANKYKAYQEGSTCYDVIEARHDGIYRTEIRCTGGDKELKIIYSGYMIFPASMTPGKPVVINYTTQHYVGGELSRSGSHSYQITLVGKTKVSLNTGTVDGIDIMYYEEPALISTYAEGAGYVYPSSTPYDSISVDVAALHDWPAKKSGSSGGGAANAFWLLIAVITAGFRQRRRYC